jgi:hypothetical protein
VSDKKTIPALSLRATQYVIFHLLLFLGFKKAHVLVYFLVSHILRDFQDTDTFIVRLRPMGRSALALKHTRVRPDFHARHQSANRAPVRLYRNHDRSPNDNAAHR